MKKSFYFLLSLLLIACSNSSRTTQTEPAYSSDSASSMKEAANASGSVAMDPKYDRGRKVIRKAYARFRTKDVLNNSITIEQNAAKLGGYVSYTNMVNSTDETRISTINSDSALEVRKMSFSNHLVLHVPHKKLDSFWTLLKPVIEILDSRKIEANTLVAAPKNTTEAASIEQKAKIALQDVNTIYTAENGNTVESNDDLLSYARIELDIYQLPVIKKSIISNTESIDQYKPSIGRRIWNAILDGASYLLEFILALIHGWPLVLLIIAGAWFLRKKLKRSK
jgi:hypothetical protein